MRRMALPLVIILTILCLLNWFIYSMASHSFISSPTWLAALIIAGIILMPASMIISMTRLNERLRFLTLVGHIWMGVFTIAFFFACVQFVFSLFSVTIHSSWMLYATLVISLWSLRVLFMNPQVITHQLKGPDFMRGFRIAQISDLHVGMPTLRLKWLQNVVDLLNTTAPSAVVVTGDLVDVPYAIGSPLLEPLSQIAASKFYVTGNHEYIRGGNWEHRLGELGFQVLHNSNVIIPIQNGQLLLAGVPDRGVNRLGNKSIQSNPDLALETKANVSYKILLAHEPSSVFDLKNQKCDLLLSGHTHGGQIFPFALFVRMVQPVVAGFKIIKGVNVFAHQGTGFWGPPMRWFTRCEIVIFEWI